MGDNRFMEKLVEKIKAYKNKEFIIAVLIIAVIISIYLSTIDHRSTEPAEEKEENRYDIKYVDADETADSDLEMKLKQKLSAIKGAGKVEVMITYKSGKEYVPALSQVESSTVTKEQDASGGVRTVTQSEQNNEPVTMNDSSGAKPLILKEIEPEIKGVIVIAEGADDLGVRIELRRAVQTALGLNANQVEVFTMEKEEEKE